MWTVGTQNIGSQDKVDKYEMTSSLQSTLLVIIGGNLSSSAVVEVDKVFRNRWRTLLSVDDMVEGLVTRLEQENLINNTYIMYTSDHGYHLGEHDFWAKVSLRDESAGVPLIISVPGKQPAVCDSLVELLDLYPTVSKLCGLPVEKRLQGKDISSMLDNPEIEVRDAAFSVAPMRKGFLLREKRWAFIQYGEDASLGMELFDTVVDPLQFDNLAGSDDYKAVVERMQSKLAEKLAEVRVNDL